MMVMDLGHLCDFLLCVVIYMFLFHWDYLQVVSLIILRPSSKKTDALTHNSFRAAQSAAH